MVELLSAGLGGVFLFAAAMKLTTDRIFAGGVITGVYSFAADIADQQVIAAPWALDIARLVVGFEIFLGIWLLLRVRLRAALTVALVTLLLFTGYLVLAYMSGTHKPCGCMGSIGSDGLMLGLGRNLVLLSMCGFALRFLTSGANPPCAAASSGAVSVL